MCFALQDLVSDKYEDLVEQQLHQIDRRFAILNLMRK